MKLGPVNYALKVTPTGYVCADCGAQFVRLYRDYQTFLDHQRLRCTACALKDQEKERPSDERAHSIGWLVAAVPTQKGDTFWGYTSVPDAGVAWWDRLPVRPAELVYCIVHWFGERDERQEEVLQPMYRTKEAAIACVEGREGRSFEWEHHGGHGSCWIAREGSRGWSVEEHGLEP